MEKKELTVKEILEKKDVKDVFKLGLNNVLKALENEDYELINEVDDNNNVINTFLEKVEK